LQFFRLKPYKTAFLKVAVPKLKFWNSLTSQKNISNGTKHAVMFRSVHIKAYCASPSVQRLLSFGCNIKIVRSFTLEKFFKHPGVIIAVIAAVTVVFAAQLPRARIDTNLMNFLPEDTAERIIAKHFEAEYDDTIMVMVGLERLYGTVFESDFLSRIREFTETVEAMELVKDTNSIMSTQYITSDSESIIVTDLVDENFSGTKEEIAELKRRIASWDLYRGALVSDDHTSTQIVVNLKATSEESGNPEVMAALMGIRDLAKEMFAGYAEVYTAGEPVVSATLTESIFADIIFLIPLVVVVLLGVLVFSFQRISFVTLPLLTVIVAVIWAVGAMPLFNVTLTMVSVILPVILFAVGSAYAIHVVSHYKDELNGKTLTAEEHRVFVLNLTKKLIKPVFLAALTTFAGFISFCFTPLSTIRDFGIFASVGVMVAFAVAITLVPAILIRDPQAVKIAVQKKTRKEKPVSGFENKLADTMTGIAKKKALVLVITALVIAASVIGASKMTVDDAMVEYFNKNSEVSRSDRFIRKHFGGSSQIIVSVEADDTQTLLNPEVLGALDGLCAYLTERVPEVGKVTGFTDMIKRMNQMFNADESPDGIRESARISADEYAGDEFGFGEFGDFGFEDGAEDAPATLVTEDSSAMPSAQAQVSFAMLNAAAGKHANMNANDLVRELERMANYDGYAYYEIPTDPVRYGKQNSEELQQLVSNYLVLLAGDSDETMSNDPLEPTAIETIVLINSQWQKDVQKVIRAVNDYVEANFPKNVKVLVGGGSTLEGALSNLLMKSQVISIIMSVFIVLLIVAISNKSFAGGLIAALPLTIAILGNFAVMGFLGITLNQATALIASLTVGIGIDYTIHFIEAFKREYETGGDYLHRTFATSGKAILINAVSVGGGFLVLAFSQFRIMAQFGSLVALSMAISAIVSLTVIPVLLTVIKPKFIYGKNSALR
jgi:predicted RND superfamily exporter protein